MTIERLLPQLAMIRRCLTDLPPVQIPQPYTLRTFQEGDEVAWEKIVDEAFGKEPGTYHFDPLVRNLGKFRAENVFFIVSPDDEPVATATGVSQEKETQKPARLHMVGVLKSHRGKKLGYWVSLAAMRQLAEEGADKIRLLSDDFRLAAVKTYLDLGFEPYLVDENQRERWRNVFTTLGDKGNWIARFADLLKGPVHEK